MKTQVLGSGPSGDLAGGGGGIALKVGGISH